MARRERHECHLCGRILFVAEDQTGPDSDEVCLDTRLATCEIPDWVCGDCLDQAEDEEFARSNPNRE